MYILKYQTITKSRILIYTFWHGNMKYVPKIVLGQYSMYGKVPSWYKYVCMHLHMCTFTCM